MPNNFKFFTFYFFLFLNNHLYPQSILINDFQVNENISWTSHYDPQITMLADGSSIIVWYDYKNTNADIFLQRFDKNLNRVGEEVLVNNNAGSSSQEKPDIDVNRNGGFVTVWMDSRAGNDEIYAQIFDSLAHPIGENFSVNEGADDLSEYSYPSVAVSNDGSFVVVWQGRRNNEYGIFTKVFNKNGQSVTDVFRVNDSSSSSDQYVRPDIGMDDNDNFVVVWEDVLPNIHRYIFAQRFTIPGNRIGNNFKVNDDENDRYHGNTSVSAFPGGGFVVTWIDERNFSYDIYAQKFNENGIPIGSNFIVNDVAFGQQFTPVVSTSSSGKFAIIWKDGREAGSTLYDIFLQVYNADGTPIGPNKKVRDDENTMYYLTPPSLDMDSTGDFIIVWNELYSGDFQIFAQRFDSSGINTGSPFLVNNDEGSGNQINPAICVNDSGDFVIVWEEDRLFGGDIYLRLFTREGNPVGEQYSVNDIAGTAISSPAMGLDSLGDLLIVWLDNRMDDQNIYGQRLDKYVNPIGENFQINVNHPDQGITSPKISMNHKGNSVVGWTESNWVKRDFYVQRFDSGGNLMGENYKVNNDDAYIGFWEGNFAVGIDDSSNVVTSWLGHRGSAPRIYFKIYDSNGGLKKEIDSVNINEVDAIQSISMDVGSNGSFVITWSNWNIMDRVDFYGQLFNPSGIPIGNNIFIYTVSGNVANWEFSPAVSINGRGDFCFAWQDDRNNNYDIYGQLYSYQGPPLNGNFNINSYQNFYDQKNPSLFLLDNYAYTVWEDNRVPGQGWDIFTNVINVDKLNSTNHIQFYPNNFKLAQNYPNPFNPSSTIKYSVPQQSFVTIKVFDVLGKEITTLVNEEMATGIYNVTFDGSNLTGGVYFYRLQAGDFIETKKMILLR